MDYFERAGVLVLQPDAYMDLTFKDAALPRARQHLDDGGRAVLVDCAAVDLINSHGISALLSIYDGLDAVGGTLAFAQVDAPLVENALQISGLTGFCEGHFYATADDALAALTDA
ncbi:MAG: STAS domain-containing protein [Bacteroidetes bacterium]|jgi:anti-anti-sigma regulatory factor|nr:STAS domain-containing protein [Bacteroidota bacterium]